MMSDNAPIISVRNLCKSFGELRAVNDLSFDVLKGDVFGFLGPNGAGKSTTIRMLLTLIRPDSGTIRIFDKNLNTHRREILTGIGSIIEKPDLYNYLSAKKNLEIFARVSGATIGKNRIDEMLDFVGLASRAHSKVRTFSHGMKQRLGIAQALLHDPDLIILDEPTTGLDPQGIIEVRNLILQLKNERQKTILLSSHNLNEIEMIASRMIIIASGEKKAEGYVSELLNTAEMLVNIYVDDVAKASALIKEHLKTEPEIDTANRRMQLKTAKENVAGLNRLLVQNGIEVSGLESRRSLEDLFINLTQQ
jgi:ABC-type multidrug transport system ATPase subunit